MQPCRHQAPASDSKPRAQGSSPQGARIKSVPVRHPHLAYQCEVFSTNRVLDLFRALYFANGVPL